MTDEKMEFASKEASEFLRKLHDFKMTNADVLDLFASMVFTLCNRDSIFVDQWEERFHERLSVMQLIESYTNERKGE